MEIKGLSFTDQLRMMRGVEGIYPKKSEGAAEGLSGVAPQAGGKTSFADYLKQQFDETNKLGIEAESAIQRSVLGDETNPHAAMIAVQKADISLSLLMSVKERIERAYQELIRTPV